MMGSSMTALGILGARLIARSGESKYLRGDAERTEPISIAKSSVTKAFPMVSVRVSPNPQSFDVLGVTL